MFFQVLIREAIRPMLIATSKGDPPKQNALDSSGRKHCVKAKFSSAQGHPNTGVFTEHLTRGNRSPTHDHPRESCPAGEQICCINQALRSRQIASREVSIDSHSERAHCHPTIVQYSATDSARSDS